MSWSWFSQLSDAFKKRVGKYLINRYLGPFLDEGILLNQLSVDGPIRLRDVALNTSYINAFLEDADIPLEFIDGYIRELSVTVPMANLLKDNCLFEINGLTLTLQVKKRSQPSQINASIFYSMYESFSSLNVAEDCLKQNDVTDSPGRSTLTAMSLGAGADSSVLGVELLAEAIDSIIMRVQVLLTDTTIRLEYVPTVAPKGLAIELRVGKISYAGEAVNNENVMTNSTTKKISFEDVTLYSDEFSFHRHYATPDRDEDDDECDDAAASSSNHKEDRQPLKLAALTGQHELIVRFADTNHFGLPRTLEEVEVNLGGILLHLFPHQIHTINELFSAMAASRPNQDSPSKHHNRDPPACLESVLQQSMILEPVGLRVGQGGWSSAADEDLTSRSSEFVAMPKINRRLLRPSSQGASGVPNASASSSPRVVIRAVNLLAVLIERDEGVAKLGGESTKTLAMDKMHEMVAKFFAAAAPTLDSARIRGKLFDSANDFLSSLCQSSSNIQIVCSPLSVVHEEGRQDVSTAFPDDFLTKTSVTIGQLSVREHLWPVAQFDIGVRHTVPEVIPVIQFDPFTGSNPYHRPADFKLVIKESRMDYSNMDSGDDSDDGRSNESHSSISLQLNPCTINFDPGLIDRTYMLCNYTEFDPCCLMTPNDARASDSSESSSSLLVNILSPQVHLNFFVPKADMRNPPEIQVSEFVSAFWTRTVHPEIFQIDMADLDLTVTRDDTSSPVVVALGTNRISINFQENMTSEKLPLLVARKSQRNLELPQKRAAYITVTVQTAEINEERVKRNGFHEVPRPNATYFGSSAAEEGVAGTSNAASDNRSSVLHQALEHGRLHNNLGLNLQFDELSLVVPNKHAYELIYNRLGNDLLLWTPVFLRVKQFLFHHPVPDPLRDPDAEFLNCPSGAWQHKATSESIPVEMTQSVGAGDDIFDLFPKSNLPGLTIHTDTYVALSINKGFVAICSNVCDEQQMIGELPNQGGFYIFSAILSSVELKTAVGLERSPEICLLGLSIKDKTVSFGKTSSRLLNVRGTHFNEKPAGENSMSVLLDRTHWHHFSSDAGNGDNLLQLTSKILFDSKANLKTIDLGIVLRETSLCWSLSTTPPAWIDWLIDFFTVVEYPVVGYIPPAILTELRFDLRHCTFDVTHNIPAGHLTLALGHVQVHCNLLDTGRDVSIGLSVEDVALYASIDPDNFLTTSICFCDLDYLDLNVSLIDEPRPVLDVSASCNQLRLRTCVDTIVHITDLIKAVTVNVDSSDQEGLSTQQSIVEPPPDVFVDNNDSDIVPDLADAMAELDSAARKLAATKNAEVVVPDGKSRLIKKGSKKSKSGGQVFFFPDENHRLAMGSSFPSGLGMTESFYAGQHVDDDDDEDGLNASDDSLEGFCFLDAVGTGFTKNGEASVQQLDSDPVIFVENHFPPPSEKSIDYLKTPNGFPDFASRITLKRISILWQIYGGKDLSPGTSFTVLGGGGIGTDRSIVVSTIVGKGGLAETLKTRGGPHRIESQLIEVHLTQLSMQHELYPESCREASRQIVVLRAFEIVDRLAASDFNKLLHLHSSSVLPRQSNANMFSMKCVNLRLDGGRGPIPEETNVSVSLQPLRVNIDQDTLLFLIDFFSTLFPSLSSLSSTTSTSHQTSTTTTDHPITTDEARGMTIRYTRNSDVVEIQPEVGEEASEERFNIENEMEDDDEIEDSEPSVNTNSSEHISTATASSQCTSSSLNKSNRGNQPYIRTFIFSRDVPIRIDYSAKYLDLSQGALAGLLTGLTSLNCSELTLKKVCYRNGIAGIDKLVTLLVTDWLADIRQNQIPQILGGVGPMHSVLQLMQGVKDLVLMPVEQYQKDGRILRGLQRGAHSFTSSTAMSLLDMTNRLLGVIKFAAELAFDIMSPEGTVVQGKIAHHPSLGHRRAGGSMQMRRRPNDMREGVFNAFAIVQEGFDETARSLAVAVATEHARRGMTGAVGGILRQVPSNLVRPVILAATATSNVLEGVKCHVAPDSRRDEEDKWKQSQAF